MDCFAALAMTDGVKRDREVMLAKLPSLHALLRVAGGVGGGGCFNKLGARMRA